MKQQVPVPAIVAAIVVIVALVCFLGFKMMAPDHSKDGNAPSGPTAEQKAQYEASYQRKSSPGGGQSSTGMQGYPGSGGSTGSGGGR